MKATVGLVIALVLSALCVIHVVWALRRTPPSSAVIPEVEGRPAFVPGTFATLAVAVGLAAAALSVALQSGVLQLSLPLPLRLLRWSCGLVGAAFVLRAVGDFRLVGFFKSVKSTRFARWDTGLFSPLCLTLGVGALWLALI